MSLNDSYKSLFCIFIALLLFSCRDYEYNGVPAPSSQNEDLAQEIWNKKSADGQLVFAQNCNNCHNAPHIPYRDGTRWRSIFSRLDEEWVLHFILSSSSVREAGDRYAIEIKKEYGNREFEHEFGEQLDKEEVENLMVYLKNSIELNH